MKLKSTDTSPIDDINCTKPAKAPIAPAHGMPDKHCEEWDESCNEATKRFIGCLRHDEAFRDLCRCLYEDGYVSAGSLLCKLREYGTKWQSLYTGPNYICLKDDALRCSKITPVLHRLFATKKQKTK